MNTETFRRHRWTILAVILLVVVAGVALLARVVFAGQSPQWQRYGLAGQTIHSLAVSTQRTGILFAGAEDGVYRRDAGGSWHRVLRSEAVWSVELLPDDRTVIAADQAGNVNVSRDDGLHWRQNMVTPDGVYAVTTRPDAPLHILAGAGGGLYSSDDGGVHWQRRLTLHNAGGSAFAWQSGSTRTVFAGAVATAADGAIQVFVSHDAGLHWRVFGSHLGSRGGIMSLAAPSARLYAGTMGNLIWSITARGKTWLQLPNGLPQNQHVSGIATLPAHAHTLFITTLAAGIFRTDDGGSSWHSVSNGLPSTEGEQITLSVAYSPRDRVLYAGTLDGVYGVALSAAR